MKKTRFEVEMDVSNLVEKIACENNLENDFYGDSYPQEVMKIENKMERCTNEDDYEYYLDEVKEIFESYIG